MNIAKQLYSILNQTCTSNISKISNYLLQKIKNNEVKVKSIILNYNNDLFFAFLSTFMYLLNIENREWLCYFMIENYNNSKLLEDLLIVVNKKNKIKRRKIRFVLLKIKRKISN